MLDLDEHYFCKDALKKMTQEKEEYSAKDVISCLMHIFTHNGV